nr:glycoside hydrolase family 2 TIM barrel-domain containing protein [Candidatus Sigynarchaeota archaeon]
MRTNRLSKRIPVEVIPYVLVLYFVTIGLSLLIANEPEFEILNSIISELFHAKADYTHMLLIIFSAIGVYSGIVAIAGVKRPAICHNAVNILIPPAIIVLLSLILITFTSVNFRIRLDFIWFSFGAGSIFIYLLFVGGMIAIFSSLLGGFMPLWKASRVANTHRSQLSPRTTAIFLLTTLITSLPMLLTTLFYFPYVQVFWTNMNLLYRRYTEGFLQYLLILVMSACSFIFLAWYTGKYGKRGKGYKITILFGLSVTNTIAVMVLLALARDIRTKLLGELPLLELYAVLPLALILAIIAVIQLKMTSVLEKLRGLVERKVRSRFLIAMSRITKRRALGAAVVVIVAMSTFYVAPVIIPPPLVDIVPDFELREVNGITMPFQNGAIYPNFEHQPETTEGGTRTCINLTGTWRFIFTLGPSDLSYRSRTQDLLSDLGAGFESLLFDDTSWTELDVPSSFNRLDSPMAEYQGAQGVCWYRKWIASPALDNHDNQSIVLKCLGSNYITDAWVDGNYTGYHEGGFTSFAYDITNLLLDNATQHLLAIRVDTGGFKNAYYTKEVPGFADWFNYGGIVRDIYIDVMPRVHVIRADARATTIVPDAGSPRSGQADIILNISMELSSAIPEVSISLGLHPLSFSSSAAMLDERTWDYINNSAEIAPEIVSGSLSKNISAAGSVDGRYIAAIFTFQARNLLLWTNTQPALYAIEINITAPGIPGIVDHFFTQTGFRNFTAGSSGFTLNGAPVYITGASLHEEIASCGRTLSRTQIATDLALMQNLSCNTFRSHYPVHPFYYLLADRIGLSSWQECPDYWFNEVNLIEASARGTTIAMFLEMLFRDFNRPSIWFAGVTNEPLSEGLIVPYLQERKELLASIDRSRVLGFAAASPYLRNPAHAVTDVVAANCYWGITDGVIGDHYNQAMYATSVIASANPGKPILITEFGAGDNRYNESVQTFNEYCTAFQQQTAIHGILYWVFNDYIGYSGHWGTWGVYNRDRTQERPTGEIMRIIYSNLTQGNP